MNQRFTYLGDTVIEFVVDGDTLAVNVLPMLDNARPMPGDPLPPGPEGDVPPVVPAFLPPPDPASVAAPLELCAAAPAPTPRQRASKGTIRAVWTGVFSAGGVALVYALDNITALNLSPAIGLAVGAVGYGAKAALFPTSKF